VCTCDAPRVDLGWISLSKIFTIFEGTSEIQRMIIARSVTGLDVR
jgi:alkylation response protein AidB-like acyl-CoA dehydrogenase